MANIQKDPVFHCSPQVILVADASGRILRINPTAEKKFNCQNNDCELTDFGIALKIEDIQTIINNSSDKLIKTKVRERYYNFYVQGSSAEERCYFFGDDTTALVKRKKELKKQQEFLRKVIDSDPSLIFVKDEKGRFLLGNKALAEVYGTTTLDVVGKTDADFNDQLEECEHFNEDDHYVITQQKPLIIKEEMVTKASGEQCWLETIKVPLVMEDGSVAVLGIAQNITERKELQNQLIEAQKIEAIAKLAGGVAHDFNNLLTAIISSAELITLDINNHEEVLNYANVIEKTAGQANKLSNKLLTFSHQQSKPGGAQILSFHEILNESLTVIESILENDIEITISLAAEKHLIKADLVEIQQLILNLVINARDALKCREDNKLISIHSKNIVLDLADSKRLDLPVGEYLLLKVSDNGCGIEEENLAHIFEPFYSTKTEQNGTGLGLAVVYGVVKSHGGKITVKSKPGTGTNFKVYLPLTSPAALPAPSREGIKAKSSKNLNKQILIVDDFQYILDVTSRMLERVGFSTITASSCSEAIEIYQQQQKRIDYVILDVVTPGISAGECLEELKQINPEVKVLLASGYSSNEDIAKLLSNGAMGFIQKPYEIDDLIRRLS